VVEQDDEFPHHGHQRHFGRFVGGHQPLVEDLQLRIMEGGDDRGHVEGAPCQAAPTLDQPVPPPWAAVTIHGSHADQRGGLAAIEYAQFREGRQEHQRGHAAHAFNDAEARQLVGQGFCLLHQLSQPSIELFQLPRQAQDMPLQLAAQVGMRQVFQAVVFGGHLLLELGATGDQLGQVGLGRAGGGTGVRLQAAPVVSQDGGIEAVGFGVAALGTSEVAGLAGIDDGDPEFGRGEGGNGSAFIAAGGSADDADGAEFAQPGDEGAVAGAVIRELVGFGVGLGLGVEVEGGFSDIHSDVDEGH
jgi:hypothetical protein